jgi:hypothetical protein
MPFIIFKGKHNSNLCKKLQNLQFFKDKLIYITTNENAWMTSDLFIEYIENILVKDNNKKKLLILDHCTSHDTPIVLDKLKKNNVDIIFIPKRMTSVLQHLDRCINFPFKKYLKFKFSDYSINEGGVKNNLDESRIRIINDILSIWNGYKDEISKENYIENSLIEKSFKLVAITNKMDGSEDQIFDGFDIINQLEYLKNEANVKLENNSENNSGSNLNLDENEEEGGEYEIEEESHSEEK